MLQKIRNTFIIFVVSGFWHGANWTFIIWGLLNALYILPLIVFGSNRTYLNTVAQGKYFPTFREVFSVGLTFFLTMIAWIFFRAETVKQGISIMSNVLKGLFSKSGYVESLNLVYWDISFGLPLLIILFFMIEWFGREKEFALERFGIKWPLFFRWTFYFGLLFLILYYSGSEVEFIYFQF